MAKSLLLNMREYTIVKEFETMEEAITAQDDPAYAGFPKHLVERDNWDLTAVDLVHFYNRAIPADAAPVKRFSDRATGMARLLRVLNGEILPVVDETAVKEQTRKKRTGELHTDTTTEEGTDGMAKKKAKKGGAKKSAKKSTTVKGAPRERRNSLGDNAVLKPTKAGTDRKWHEGSPRAKLFAHLVKRESMTVKEFITYGVNSVGLKAEQVRAAIGKLLDSKILGGASVKATKGEEK